MESGNVICHNLRLCSTSQQHPEWHIFDAVTFASLYLDHIGQPSENKSLLFEKRTRYPKKFTSICLPWQLFTCLVRIYCQRFPRDMHSSVCACCVLLMLGMVRSNGTSSPVNAPTTVSLKLVSGFELYLIQTYFRATKMARLIYHMSLSGKLHHFIIISKSWPYRSFWKMYYHRTNNNHFDALPD